MVIIIQLSNEEVKILQLFYYGTNIVKIQAIHVNDMQSTVFNIEQEACRET